MLNIINNLVITLLCILCMTCSLGNNEDEVTTYHTIINGTIIDEKTKLPIEDVEVDLDLKFSLFYNRFKGRAYTDSLGKFRFEDYYTPGENEFLASYNLDIDKKGYYGKSDYNEGVIKGTENDITIELTPYPLSFHTVANGKFLEKITENPIEGVKVYFLRNVTYSSSNLDTAAMDQSNNAGVFYVEDFYDRKDTDERIPIYILNYKTNGYDTPKNNIVISADSTKEVIYYLTPTKKHLDIVPALDCTK